MSLFETIQSFVHVDVVDQEPDGENRFVAALTTTLGSLLLLWERLEVQRELRRTVCPTLHKNGNALLGVFFCQNNCLRALLGGAVWILMEKIDIHTHFFTFVLNLASIIITKLQRSQKNVFLLFLWGFRRFWALFVCLRQKSNFTENFLAKDSQHFSSAANPFQLSFSKFKERKYLGNPNAF